MSNAKDDFDEDGEFDCEESDDYFDDGNMNGSFTVSGNLAGNGVTLANTVLQVGTNGTTTWGLSGSYVSHGDLEVIRKDLQAIKARLCILEPNPEQMEKFQALRDAYDHFKCMERLCVDDLPPPEPI